MTTDATLTHLWQALQALKEGSYDRLALKDRLLVEQNEVIAHAIAHVEAALDTAHKSHNDLALVMLQPCALGLEHERKVTP